MTAVILAILLIIFLILLAVYTVLYWIGSIVLMRHGVYDPTAMAVFCA